jgi:hypothetical protein
MQPLNRQIGVVQINHAGDGGLYAEMIKDRSFDAAAYLSVYLESNKTVPREVLGKRPNQPLGERYIQARMKQHWYQL